MADFKIVAPVPFEVEGADGTVYQLPRLSDLSAEQVGAMGELSKFDGDADGTAERTEAIKRFVLVLCPALADEPLTDMGYTRLFAQLAAESGIKLGES